MAVDKILFLLKLAFQKCYYILNQPFENTVLLVLRGSQADPLSPAAEVNLALFWSGSGAAQGRPQAVYAPLMVIMHHVAVSKSHSEPAPQTLFSSELLTVQEENWRLEMPQPALVLNARRSKRPWTPDTRTVRLVLYGDMYSPPAGPCGGKTCRTRPCRTSCRFSVACSALTAARARHVWSKDAQWRRTEDKGAARGPERA